MEKKKSVGVKIFSYFGFIFGVFGVIEAIPNVDLIEILIGVAYIVLSLNLLRLKNWSRVLLMMLNSIWALLVIGAFIMLTVTLIIPSIPLGVHWKELGVELVGLFRKIYPHFTIIALIGFLIGHIYLFGFLIFFTRTKVKEQFKK